MENPILSLVVGGIALFIILVIYFLPTLIAQKRKHKQYQPITLVNLFFGWTILGWFIALIWAVSYQEQKS